MPKKSIAPKISTRGGNQKYLQTLEEKQVLFHTFTLPEINSFRADVQDQWRTSARRTQRSVRIASLGEKRSAVIDELDALVSWLFNRLRDSVVLRLQIGISLTADVDQSFTWAWDGCGTDLALAVIPDAYQFRFKSNHERAGERVPVGNLAKYRREFGEDAIEVVTYPLSQQNSGFFEALLANWLSVACDSSGLAQNPPAWASADPADGSLPQAEGPFLTDGRYTAEQTNTLLNQSVAKLRQEIDNAWSYAHQHVIRLAPANCGNQAFGSALPE